MNPSNIFGSSSVVDALMADIEKYIEAEKYRTGDIEAEKYAAAVKADREYLYPPSVCTCGVDYEHAPYLCRVHHSHLVADYVRVVPSPKRFRTIPEE